MREDFFQWGVDRKRIQRGKGGSLWLWEGGIGTWGYLRKWGRRDSSGSRTEDCRSVTEGNTLMLNCLIVPLIEWNGLVKVISPALTSLFYSITIGKAVSMSAGDAVEVLARARSLRRCRP